MKRLISLLILIAVFSCVKDTEKPEEEITRFCWECETYISQKNYECGIHMSNAGSMFGSRINKCDMTVSEARTYETSLGSITSTTEDATKCTNGHPKKLTTKEIRVTCSQKE